MSDNLELPGILDAHQRIKPHVQRTQLVRSGFLSDLAGSEVWLKLECHQPTGSFKVRGAVNKVGLLDRRGPIPGVVTGSAGNHGLGVAHASAAWNVPVTDIFVPVTAPRAKLDKLLRFPINLHQVGETYEDAHQAAEAYSRQTGAVYISAYDDPEIIAGQGTIGVEILEDLPLTDVMLVPVGGGGLIAGIAIAAKAMRPGVRVVGLQPSASPSALLSLQDGIPYDPYAHGETIADGLAGGFGRVPFRLAAHLIDDIRLASETELREAIFTLADREELVVEASGAIAIIPLLRGDPDLRDRTVVCVLSGGNLERSLLKEILAEYSRT